LVDELAVSVAHGRFVDVGSADVVVSQRVTKR
jgi:hypothetical protein